MEDVDKFWGYLKDCDLYMEDGMRYELSIPVNSAFQWFENYEPFKEQYERFMNDKEYRCRTIRYHIMPAGETPRIASGETNRTVHWRTNNRDESVAPLWQNIHYGSGVSPYNAPGDYYFHYGRVIDKTHYSYPNAWISRIDRVLVFPERNITDIVNSRDDSKINSKLFAKTEYPNYLKKESPRNLYLMVQDEGMLTRFDEDGNMKGPRPYVAVGSGNGSAEKEMEALFRERYLSKDEKKYFNRDYAYNFSLFHTVPNYYWTGDIGYYDYDRDYYLYNYYGSRIQLRRSRVDGQDVIRMGMEGTPIEQWSRLLQYNIPARDGMIWLLDKPLGCHTDSNCEPKLSLKVIIYKLSVVSCRSDLVSGKEVHKEYFNQNMDKLSIESPDDCRQLFVNSYPNFDKLDVVES
ncbi:hypothetical protein Ciccas_011313 [Cichlidogyrus casuarinus]|uniref:Uncharacterized protein n=1 Tax=Cichlidogyrus casuarinus TaxID=1844966 RepID=A0ABD2PRL3_9PLAT